MAQSRNEKLLEALLNGETADIVPQSRNEAYLKAMIEGNTEVAEPHSRIEAYLCALARNGGSSGGGGTGGGGGWPEVPDDGATYLYITLQEGRTSPMLGVGVNGTVTVDWGDGTEPDVLTGTSTNASVWTGNHAYAKAGDYVIRLMVDGYMMFLGNNSTNQGAYILRHSSGADTRNYAYEHMLKRVKIGDNVINIGSYAFFRCSAISAVVIPENVISIASYAFSDCYNLPEVNIPGGVTRVDIGTFSECHSLQKMVLPSGIISIGKNAFSNCYSMQFYDFTACTAVPTLSGTNAFTGIPADCEIRVPAALYDEWIAATNWATYADYIKAY